MKRLRQNECKKKIRGQNIYPSQCYGQNKILIRFTAPPVNRDFFKIYLSITLARINILTSSFFLAITLSKALHLTPKLLKLERIFFSPYKGGPIFKNPFPEAVFWYKTFFFIFSGIFHIKYLIAPYRPTKFQNHWSLMHKRGYLR